MKYIMFWEYDFEDHVRVIEKLKQFRESIKKEPEKFPKFISKNYAMLEGPRGFQLLETENEDHLVNFVLHYQPEVSFDFQPIIEVKKSLELMDRVKK
ncbi:MAG: DUF3303 domain-containing protein [Candidatus Hermodarchaeota archaeon]